MYQNCTYWYIKHVLLHNVSSTGYIKYISRHSGTRMEPAMLQFSGQSTRSPQLRMRPISTSTSASLRATSNTRSTPRSRSPEAARLGKISRFGWHFCLKIGHPRPLFLIIFGLFRINNTFFTNGPTLASFLIIFGLFQIDITIFYNKLGQKFDPSVETFYNTILIGGQKINCHFYRICPCLRLSTGVVLFCYATHFHGVL